MSDDFTTPRVRVDTDLCEGHALCIQLAPDVFDLSDDDEAGVSQPQRWDRSTRDSVKSAVDACPRQAISLLDPSMKGA